MAGVGLTPWSCPLFLRSIRKFSVDVSHLDTTEPLLTLDQLSVCVNFQYVSVKMKVLSITEVINRELHKQECTIADATWRLTRG